MKRTSYILYRINSHYQWLSSRHVARRKPKMVEQILLRRAQLNSMADESLSPIIDEERIQFEFEFPKAKLKPNYTDEVTGLQMIKDFKTTLLFTTRHLKDSEIAYLKSKSNVIPSVFPIGYDGLAFIVNKNNQDTCITVNDIKRVLTGKATKWSDIVPGSKERRHRSHLRQHPLGYYQLGC